MRTTFDVQIRLCQLRKSIKEAKHEANILSKLSAGEPIEGTWIESLAAKSINKDICMADIVKDCTTPIREFILHEKLPMTK